MMTLVRRHGAICVIAGPIIELAARMDRQIRLDAGQLGNPLARWLSSRAGESATPRWPRHNQPRGDTLSRRARAIPPRRDSDCAPNRAKNGVNSQRAEGSCPPKDKEHRVVRRRLENAGASKGGSTDVRSANLRRTGQAARCFWGRRDLRKPLFARRASATVPRLTVKHTNSTVAAPQVTDRGCRETDGVPARTRRECRPGNSMHDWH